MTCKLEKQGKYSLKLLVQLELICSPQWIFFGEAVPAAILLVKNKGFDLKPSFGFS